MLRILIVGVLIFANVAMAPDAALAQSRNQAEEKDDTKSKRRFSLTIGGSRAFVLANSWSDQLESALIRASLADTDPGGCSILFGCTDPEERPATRPGSSESAWITANLRLKDRMELRFRAAYRGELGTTIGYGHDSFEGGSVSYSLYVKPSVALFAASLMYEIRPRLWVGLGPALGKANFKYDSYVVSNTPTYSIYLPDKCTANMYGVVLETAYRLPFTSRFFLELSWQYFLMTEANIGPIELRLEDGTVGRRLPDTGVNFNWGQLGIGLGISF